MTRQPKPIDRKEVMTRFGAPRRAMPRRPGANSPRFIDRASSLPNRIAVMSEVDFALTQQPYWVAVLLVHADPPASVSRQGRDLATEVVTALGTRLRQALRPSDLIGRLGDFEVGAALWGLDDPEPASVVEGRVRQAFETAVTLRDHHHPLPVQLGIGVVRPGDTPSTALALAWSAMNSCAPIRPLAA